MSIALIRYNLGLRLYIFFLNNQPQQLMTSNSDYNLFSLKYIAASFAATYFSGVVHPLELIKTRFQSRTFLTKVMMVGQLAKILSLNTPISEMHSKLSMSMRAYADYTKVSTYHYCAKLHPCHFSSGSKSLLTQLLDKKETTRTKRGVDYGRSDESQHIGQYFDYLFDSADLGDQDSNALECQ